MFLFILNNHISANIGLRLNVFNLHLTMFNRLAYMFYMALCSLVPTPARNILAWCACVRIGVAVAGFVDGCCCIATIIRMTINSGFLYIHTYVLHMYIHMLYIYIYKHDTPSFSISALGRHGFLGCPCFHALLRNLSCVNGMGGVPV